MVGETATSVVGAKIVGRIESSVSPGIMKSSDKRAAKEQTRGRVEEARSIVEVRGEDLVGPTEGRFVSHIRSLANRENGKIGQVARLQQQLQDAPKEQKVGIKEQIRMLTHGKRERDGQGREIAGTGGFMAERGARMFTPYAKLEGKYLARIDRHRTQEAAAGMHALFLLTGKQSLEEIQAMTPEEIAARELPQDFGQLEALAEQMYRARTQRSAAVLGLQQAHSGRYRADALNGTHTQEQRFNHLDEEQTAHFTKPYDAIRTVILNPHAQEASYQELVARGTAGIDAYITPIAEQFKLTERQVREFKSRLGIMPDNVIARGGYYEHLLLARQAQELATTAYTQAVLDAADNPLKANAAVNFAWLMQVAIHEEGRVMNQILALPEIATQLLEAQRTLGHLQQDQLDAATPWAFQAAGALLAHPKPRWLDRKPGTKEPVSSARQSDGQSLIANQIQVVTDSLKTMQDLVRLPSQPAVAPQV
ncbi:MAG TPA: hypothetical protein VEW42_05430 [Candidatus Eisenbacteria bacterium]|nr:hypothetical protein [Candidatus Eisenbacteria bacterium]